MTSPRSPAETRLVLIGAAVLLSLGMGIRQSFGLLLTPVTRDLALTAADFTLAVAVQNIVWGLSQAPIGPLRTARHDDGGCYNLRCRAWRHGRGRRRHGADRLRRVDRGGVVLYGFLIGADRRRPSGPGGAAEQDAGRRCRRRVARHVRRATCDASAAHPPSLANRCVVLSDPGHRDAAGRVLGRQRRPAAGRSRAPDNDARGARRGGPQSTFPRHVGGHISSAA